MPRMFHGLPIIGIAGGIGSGKSFVARVFGEMGCLVISSDEQVRQVYREDGVKAELRRWWGEQVLQPDGEINRRFIAKNVSHKSSRPCAQNLHVPQGMMNVPTTRVPTGGPPTPSPSAATVPEIS